MCAKLPSHCWQVDGHCDNEDKTNLCCVWGRSMLLCWTPNVVVPMWVGRKQALNQSANPMDNIEGQMLLLWYDRNQLWGKMLHVQILRVCHGRRGFITISPQANQWPSKLTADRTTLHVADHLLPVAQKRKFEVVFGLRHQFPGTTLPLFLKRKVTQSNFSLSLGNKGGNVCVLPREGCWRLV